MRASIRKGAPERRSRSVCSQTRMLPRSTPSGELWKLMRLGRMHAECDQLVAGPTHVADVEPRGRADFLHEAELLTQPIETIARPRQRRDPRQLRDIGHIEPDVRETAAMPAKRAHLPDRYPWAFVEPAERMAIEARLGIDAQGGAAQRDEGGNRRVDVDDSRAVQRQLDPLVVLVLFDEAERLTSRRSSGRPALRRRASRKP